MDPSRISQQSICYDLQRNLSISISWGVQIYLSFMTAKELEIALGTFQTWKSWSDEPFVFNIRSISDPCRRPVVYFLERVDSVGKGETRSTYLRYGDVLEKQCNGDNYTKTMRIDLVNVTAPLFTRDLWKKVRVRQVLNIQTIFLFIYIHQNSHQTTQTLQSLIQE